MSEIAQLPPSVFQRAYRFVNRPYYWYRPSQLAQRLRASEQPGGGLRLVRTGAVLASYAAADVNENFTFLKEYPFSSADLKSVYIDTSTNEPTDLLDVRITDLRLRAETVVE